MSGKVRSNLSNKYILKQVTKQGTCGCANIGERNRRGNLRVATNEDMSFFEFAQGKEIRYKSAMGPIRFRKFSVSGPMMIGVSNQFSGARKSNLWHMKSLKPKTPEIEAFGKPTNGIQIEEENITIEPSLLKSGLFYLFTYEKEQYVLRKSKHGTVDIFEVTS